MELRHLRYFVAVAETRNLSRAAAAVHIAQPAMSRQIRELERELGVALLDRHAKGVAPTLAGEAIARAAPQILADLAAAIDRAEATAAGRRGRLVLGALRLFVAQGFPTVVQEELRREHPEITLVVQDTDPPSLDDQLLSGAVDLALSLAHPINPTCVAVPLWEEPADLALLPADHPLARRGTLAVPDLGELPFLVAPQGYPRELLEQALATLRALGLRSSVLAVGTGLQAAHMAVATGRGWTLVTRARALAPPMGTVAVPLDGVGLLLRLGAVWRKTERRPVVRTVLEKVFEVARRHSEHRVPAAPASLPPSAIRGARRRRPAGTVPAAVEFRHLRALLAVAATQTIGRAAERLGVTQPSLSRQLRELEYAVDVPLLERSARGVLLTPAGASLAGDCPPLLLAIEELVHEATRARRGMEGRCVIGAVATGTTSELLRQVLTSCGARHPHIRVLIEEIPTPRQVPALAQGEIDLGLAHSYLRLGEEDRIVRKLLLSDRMQVALLGHTHPLATHRRLEPADLATVPFLFMDRSFYPPLYDSVMAAFAAIGLTPRVEATYDGLQAVWALAAQGKGWCLGFRSQRARPPAGTMALPVTGLDLPWGIDLLSRKEEQSPAVRAVASVIRALSQPRPGGRARAARAPAGRPHDT